MSKKFPRCLTGAEICAELNATGQMRRMAEELDVVTPYMTKSGIKIFTESDVVKLREWLVARADSGRGRPMNRPARRSA